MVYWPHAVKNPMEANIEGKNIYFPKKKPCLACHNTPSMRHRKYNTQFDSSPLNEREMRNKKSDEGQQATTTKMQSQLSNMT